MRAWRWCVLSVLTFLFSNLVPANAIGQAYLSWGITESGKYDTSAFDSIGEDHKLIIHIPVYSLKQKGSLPSLTISLVENSPSWEYLPSTYTGGDIVISYEHFNGSPHVGGSPGLIPFIAEIPGVRIHAVPYTDSNGDNYAYNVLSVVDGTGANHEVHPLTGNPNQWVATDGSRFGLISSSQTVLDGSGNTYTNASIVDLHGNTITSTYNKALSVRQSITDSLGRLIQDPNVYSDRYVGVSLGSQQCVVEDLPTFQGTQPYTFCYKDVIAQSSQTIPSNEHDIRQNPLSFISLASVQTPGGTYTFDYDSWGAVSRIGLPTGGSISYEYDTAPRSYDDPTFAPASRIVSKRTLSTGSTATQGQTSVTLYHFDVTRDPQYGFMTSQKEKITYPDGSYSTRDLFEQGSGYYPAPPRLFFSASGTLLKTVTDQQSIVNGYPQMADIFSTVWPSGRVDQQCTFYYGNTADTCTSTALPPAPVLTYYDDNQFVGTETPGATNFAPLPLSMHLPIRTEMFSTGGNNAAGALLQRHDKHYYWEGNSQFQQANLFDALGSDTLYDGSNLSVLSTSLTYDETAYSPYGVQGNPTTVSSGGISTHTSYTLDGIVKSVIDGRGNTSLTNVDFQCNGAFPHQTQNALSQQNIYTYDCSSGLVSDVQDPSGQTTHYSYDGMSNLHSVSSPDGGQKTIDYNGYAQPITATTTVAADPNPAQVTTDTYDGLGRLSTHAISAPEGQLRTTTTFDAAGRVFQMYTPYTGSSPSAFEEYHYDGLGRKIKPSTLTIPLQVGAMTAFKV